MTMHLLPVYYTTTSTKKSKKKRAPSSSLAKHEAWIAKMTSGKPIDKKVADQKWRDEYMNMLKAHKTEYNSAGMNYGSTPKPEPKVYTGTRLMGIATMHKSNMVPVFSSQDAEDISKMRRG
ncbi:hypothetical protein UFOVP247_154 [uncultured Caudovirales phage]|uniref:Uncharacterized protein n=1 Tax=uncultured Caudovirales phage TaxID=2100421 RepID=A0A6J7WXF6_9CAUD|nr:hypothetical protein UFOVP247_154 [uncultured Caudovirales phage]